MGEALVPVDLRYLELRRRVTAALRVTQNQEQCSKDLTLRRSESSLILHSQWDTQEKMQKQQCNGNTPRDQQGKLWCLTPEELKESHVRLVEPRGMQDPAIHNILTDPVMRKIYVAVVFILTSATLDIQDDFRRKFLLILSFRLHQREPQESYYGCAQSFEARGVDEIAEKVGLKLHASFSVNGAKHPRIGLPYWVGIILGMGPDGELRYPSQQALWRGQYAEYDQQAIPLLSSQTEGHENLSMTVSSLWLHPYLVEVECLYVGSSLSYTNGTN
ncbi:hypothetical protein Bca101_026148 [Brassica carinata]